MRNDHLEARPTLPYVLKIDAVYRNYGQRAFQRKITLSVKLLLLQSRHGTFLIKPLSVIISVDNNFIFIISHLTFLS